MNFAEDTIQDLNASIIDVEGIGQGENGRGGHWPESTSGPALITAGWSEAWSTIVMESGYFA